MQYKYKRLIYFRTSLPPDKPFIGIKPEAFRPAAIMIRNINARHAIIVVGSRQQLTTIGNNLTIAILILTSLYIS